MKRFHALEQLSPVIAEVKSLSTGIKLRVEEMPHGCKGRGALALLVESPSVSHTQTRASPRQER